MTTATKPKPAAKDQAPKVDEPVKDSKTGKEATAPARVSMSVTRLKFVQGKVDATTRTHEEALTAIDEMLVGREKSQNTLVVQLRAIRDVVAAVKLDELPALIDALIQDRQEFI